MPSLLKSIRSVTFEIMTTQLLLKLSHMQVKTTTFYSAYPEPQKTGLLDPLMGMSSEKGTCLTCMQGKDQCPGHFGHLTLEVPVFHPAYIKKIGQLLKIVCWNCSRVVKETDKKCQFCGQICHPAFQNQNDRLLITPETVYQIFAKMVPSDLSKITHIIKNNHPKSLIMNTFPVPPCCIRPSVRNSYDAKKSNEDEITMVLNEILKVNLQIKDCLGASGRDKLLFFWVQLQNQVCALVGVDAVKSFYAVVQGEENVDIRAGDEQGQKEQVTKVEREIKAKTKEEKELKNSILQRLSGKYGRFRGNLSGKRVNYSGRSVISPDPNLKVNEVGVPYAVSRLLTFPEVVNEGNLEYVKDLIKNDQVEKIEKQAAFQDEFVVVDRKTKKQNKNWWDYEFECDTDISNIFYEREKSQQYRMTKEVKNRNQNARSNCMYAFTHQAQVREDVMSAQKFAFEAGLDKDVEFVNPDKIFEGYEKENQLKTYQYLQIPTATLATTQKKIDVEPGDVIHRYLKNGDYVLFNRQPSLHKSSISLFRARIHPFKTFKFNVVNCTNFGADFDGDEMNIHFAQGWEATAEESTLINHEDNLVDNANGGVSLFIMQDAISGLFILSRESWFQFDDYCKFVMVDWQSLNKQTDFLGDIDQNDKVDEEQSQRLNAFNNQQENTEDNFFESFYKKSGNAFKQSTQIQQPAILFPKPVYTGKQIITQILRNHTSKNPFNYSADKNDFIIKNSQFFRGTLTKKHLGNIFSCVLKTISQALSNKQSVEQQVLDLMFSLQRITLRYMQTYGFSIGIQDIWQSEGLKNQKIKYITECFSKLGFNNYEEIEQLWRYPEFKSITSSEIPKSETHVKTDAEVSEMLSNLRNKLSEDISNHLYLFSNIYHNSTQVMSKSGSKGSTVNQIQMTTILSQQTVQNKMIQKYFQTRTIPHFSKRELHNPYQFGFIQNSFFTGLNPFEFFFHTTSGREGVIDTACKTAQTGYIQRKLLKNLESAQVDWNYNVVCEKVVLFYNEEEKMANKLYNQTLESFINDQIEILVGNSEIESGGFNFAKISDQEAQEFINSLSNLADETHFGIKPKTDEKELIIKCFQSYITSASGQKQHFLINTPQQKLKNIIKAVRKVSNKQANWIEPNTPVGALAGQSLGEPTTQMTLKTFHFAGLGNKIQGVPRLIQIFNAVKAKDCGMLIYPEVLRRQAKQKSRIDVYGAEAREELVDCQFQAQYLRNQMEPIFLEQVAQISEQLNETQIIVQIKLDVQQIKSLCINITGQTVIDQVTKQIKSQKLSSSDIQIINESIIQIHSFSCSKYELSGKLTKFIEELKHVRIYGIEGCTVQIEPYKYSDLVLTEKFKTMMKNRHQWFKEQQEITQNQQYMLFTTTPVHPLTIFNNPLVNPFLTATSNIQEVNSIFGIEAARQSLLDEIFNLYKDYGMNVCYYHVQILASFMTVTGQILGYTNQGLKQIKKNKTILLASFERTKDYLFEAGIGGISETFNEVSEDLIFGNCFKIGSGGMELQWEDEPEGATTGRPW